MLSMSVQLSNIVITPEMLKIISEIDEFKGAWQLFGRLTPERLQQLKKVATIESIGSSTRIEGAKLSDSEIEKLLSNLNTYAFKSRDEQEIAGYALTCEEVFQSYESMELSVNLIKQLHGWLLKFSDKDQRHRGEYKKLSNNVEAFDEHGKSLGVVFETTSPFKTPLEMQELVDWTVSELNQKNIHSLLIIGIFVVTFLAIHPFQDGNGRLSRILTTLLLLKSGYLYVPYSSLESIIEKNKENYYLALRRTQKTVQSNKPDFGPWLQFFLRVLLKQKNHLEQKMTREKILSLYVNELSSKIITLLHEHGKLSISEIERLTNANRNTLKKQLKDLVKSNTIARLGKGRATWYSLP
ncbi:MAG TPA: Fic family protein [Candidatus Babeliales bacterium]|nr:Fic family protein [Candidatus Babeliales bacterium]